jgi:hypothetical protein
MLPLFSGPPRAQDRASVADGCGMNQSSADAINESCTRQNRFDCRVLNDPATINKESTNENNTDVDRWADARRLRINGKPCSKTWRCLNPRAGSR